MPASRAHPQGLWWVRTGPEALVSSLEHFLGQRPSRGVTG